MRSVFIIPFVVFLNACQDNNVCKGSVHVKMRNLSGLDGCGWVLQLDNNDYLEAQNLQEYEIEFVEGKSLHVKYHETDGGSICMVGKIVQIDCLTED